MRSWILRFVILRYDVLIPRMALLKGAGIWYYRMLLLCYVLILKRTQYFSCDNIEKLQTVLLRKTLKKASRASMFWKKILREAGIDPERVISLDSLRFLPLISKRALRKRPIEDIAVTDLNDKEALYDMVTSGSTGIPFRMPIIMPHCFIYRAAFVVRALSEMCPELTREIVKNRHSMFLLNRGTLYLQLISKIVRYKSRDPVVSACDILELLSQDYAPVLSTYPSALPILAQYLDNESAKKLKFKLIESNGEYLPDESKNYFEKVFGVSIYRTYGMQEFGEIGRECRFQRIAFLMTTKGEEETLSYVKQIVGNNPNGGECHFLIHEYGHWVHDQKSAELGRLLTAKEFEELVDSGTTLCMSGYFHGIVDARFEHSLENNVDFAALVTKTCESAYDKTDARKWECIHGIGHALMVHTNNLHKSLALCELLPEEKARRLCFTNVFMQNTYAFRKDRYEYKNKKFIDYSDPLYPCNTLQDNRHKSACYALAGRSHLIKVQNSQKNFIGKLINFKKAFDICEKIGKIERSGGEKYAKRCVNYIAVPIHGMFPNNWTGIRLVCNLIDSKYRNTCLTQTALIIHRNDINSEGLASGFCSALPQKYKDSCLSRIDRDKDVDYIFDF